MDRLKRLINFPLHQSLGITSIDSSNGKAQFSIIVSDATANPNGILHGGVVYLLCDVCAYSALLSVMDDDKEGVTHDIHVSVLSSASAGDNVSFSSEVIRKGRSVCFIKVEAKVADKTIATSMVTKSIIDR